MFFFLLEILCIKIKEDKFNFKSYLKEEIKFLIQDFIVI